MVTVRTSVFIGNKFSVNTVACLLPFYHNGCFLVRLPGDSAGQISVGVNKWFEETIHVWNDLDCCIT